MADNGNNFLLQVRFHSLHHSRIDFETSTLESGGELSSQRLNGRIRGTEGESRTFLLEFDLDRDNDDDTEDVDLEEFSDEIDAWIIDELKGIGCDTAKSVLDLGVEDLVKRTDLEEETIREVMRILRSEFE